MKDIIFLMFKNAKDCMMAGGRALDLDHEADKIRAEAYRYVEAACEFHMASNGNTAAAAKRMLVIIAKICIMSGVDPEDIHPTGIYAPDRVQAPILFVALATSRLGINNHSYRAYISTAAEATIDIALKKVVSIDTLKKEME